MAVSDCSVIERLRWRPPYQTSKTVHVHTKHYKHNEDRRMAVGVWGSGSVPLSHSGNIVSRIGIYTQNFSFSVKLGELESAAATFEKSLALARSQGW